MRGAVHATTCWQSKTASSQTSLVQGGHCCLGHRWPSRAWPASVRPAVVGHAKQRSAQCTRMSAKKMSTRRDASLARPRTVSLAPGTQAANASSPPRIRERCALRPPFPTALARARCGYRSGKRVPVRKEDLHHDVLVHGHEQHHALVVDHLLLRGGAATAAAAERRRGGGSARGGRDAEGPQAARCTAPRGCSGWPERQAAAGLSPLRG